MLKVNLGVFANSVADPSKLDRKTLSEIEHANNRISKIALTARKGMHEMAINAVTASQLGAEALAMSDYFATLAPKNEATASYMRIINQHFLQRMGAITNLGNDAIIHTTGKLCS